jgi:TonB family protein
MRSTGKSKIESLGLTMDNEFFQQLVSAILVTLLALPSMAQTKKSDSPTFEIQTQAEALFDRARKLSDIRTEGAPAFRLSATFSFQGKDLSTIQGTYTEVWVSRSQWWRDTVLNDAHRTEIGGLNRYWVVDDIGDYFDIARSISALVNVLPSKVATMDFEFIQDDTNEVAKCAVSKPDKSGGKYAFCFENQTGALLERVSPKFRVRNASTYSCFYGGFRKFGGFMFPREIGCFEDKHRKLDVKIVDLAAEPAADPQLFKPTQRAVEFIECGGKRTQPEARSSPAPTFYYSHPDSNATAIISLIVDQKGKPQDLKVAKSGGKDFDKDAVSAVSRWRYKPATCDGEPIPAQLEVQIDFHRAN